MPAKLSKYAWLDLHTILLIGAVVLYLLLCTIPFIVFGQHPLGYDTGFYRRYLINPSVSFPNPPVPGVDHTIIAPRIFLDIVRFLGLSPDLSLYGSYILLCLVFVIVFYFFIKEYTNKNIALVALALLILSPVQYLGYWFMLYKNFFGLIFFFLAFIFIKKKWFWPALLCALVVPLSHQTTTILLLGILGGYILLTLLFQKKFLIPELIILALTFFTYLYLHPHVQQKIDAPPVGIFIEKLDFLLMTLPLILLTLAGLPKFFKVLKENYLLIALGGVSIIFPLLSLPYYQRIFLFTNYWLILGAAIGLHALVNFHSEHGRRYCQLILMAVVILLISHVGLLIHQITRFDPLITPDITAEIIGLQKIVPENASILTSVRLTPWVQGWTTAKVYAPGILKDQHPSWEWQAYWSGSVNERVSFLSTFPKPVYIFIDHSQSDLFVPKSSCIQKITQMLYLDNCQSKSNEHY